MLVGSFALLYSQLLLPTPSGAGAVELGFLGGAAGDLGDRAGWLLLAWRFYTNGAGVVLGHRTRGPHLRLARPTASGPAVERSRLAARCAPAPPPRHGAHRPAPTRSPLRTPPASPPHDQPRPAAAHVVELVRAGMDVSRLRLARLEAVEPDEQPLAAAEIGLGRPCPRRTRRGPWPSGRCRSSACAVEGLTSTCGRLAIRRARTRISP